MEKKADLDIVVAGKDVGYLIAFGKGMSTGHAAVHVRAGQTVWLRTYGSSRDKRRYEGGWGTWFTGLLLQPDQ